ncbi:MAG: rRNA maturation RNase YbeY [Verrucomicrobiae bacterium]|nr:rRNA maturation RNase YbeY [Verrucomicrobiae bacterium]
MKLPEWRRRLERLADLRRLRGLDVVAPALGELTAVFVDDAAIAELNWRHLRHRGATDIITFDYGDGRADLFISLDTARRQAAEYRQSFERELTLYLVHGMLHLSGFDDRTPEQRRRMRREESWFLKRLMPES